MEKSFSFTLNGENVRVEGVSPTTTLLALLRDLQKTGTKEGCAEGDCGACSVALAERDAAGRRTYRAVNSCLLLAPMVAGREVVTVEGLRSAQGLHPAQRAMVEHEGSQCGYCTPGFCMSLFEAFHRSDPTGGGGLDGQLQGNLCRCTGYRPIRDAGEAVLAAARAGARDAYHERKGGEAAPPVDYEAAGIAFQRPGSLAEVYRVLSESSEVRLVAGATDMTLALASGRVRGARFLSLGAVGELAGLEEGPDAFSVGAGVTLTRLEEVVAPHVPALADMLAVFGSRQIRNAATLGGNLATASPIGDLAPVLLALGADVVLGSATGEREVALDAFFLGYRETALRPGELIVRVRIPRGAAQGGWTRRSAAYKVSKRRDMDISTVAAAFAVDLDEGGVVRRARLAYGGVAATPARAEAAERALEGTTWDGHAPAEVLAALEEAFTPISDLRGSAAYRRRLVVRLFERFVTEHAEAAANHARANHARHP